MDKVAIFAFLKKIGMQAEKASMVITPPRNRKRFF